MKLSTAAGFTLIEVLVSLAILSIALGAGLRAAAVALDNTAELKERTLARWAGKNQLARLQLQTDLPALGLTSGQVHQGPFDFLWKVEIESTPNPDFRRATVTIQRPDSAHTLSSLQGFVVGRR